MIPLWFLHRNESIPISGFFPDCIPSDHSGRWRTKVWFRGVLVQGFGWFEAAWSSSDDHRSSQSIDGQICSGTRFVIQVSSLCAMIVCVIIIPYMSFFISLHSFRSIDILLLMYPSVLYLSSNLFGCCQTKESLRTFLQSLMSKCGKLRQCVKEIKGKYVDDASSVFLEYIRFYFIRSVLLFPLVSLQYGTRHRCLQGLLLSYKSTSRP